MKKIILLLIAICTINMAQAQYWQIPNVTAGMNPGDLNNDDENPGNSSWSPIMSTTGTPAWSTPQSIPFAFQFNGSAVSQFMVSSTGVVTFDVATTLPAPAATGNTALPSASIPDNSVCIWGITGSGTNDSLVTKVFGTAPNRQFWIQFNSFSVPANAAVWSYWSVVLEESTNNIHIVDHRSGSGTGAVTVALTAGLQINSTTALNVAGSPTLNAAGTDQSDASDNSFFTFLPGTQPTNDLIAISSNTPDYVTTGTNLPIDFRVRNHGSNAVTSYTIKYQDGTNPVVSQNITGVNIPSLGYNTSTFTTQYAISSVGAHNLKVWAELTGDANNANDTTSTLQSGVGFIPKRVVTMEEPTGTWCGWCTRGIVYMDSIHHAQPDDVAVITVHNGDPMTIAAYDAHITAITGGGWPNLTVDRNFVGDPSDAFIAYNQMIGNFGFADITQSHTNTGSTFTVDVDVKPATDLTGDYRLALIITENDVSGTGASWAQANYYSSQSNNIALSGGGVDYRAASDPIPANEINYDFVARAAVGGPAGQANSLPTSMSYNQTYSHSFTYNVPATSSAGKMQIIALLIDNASGRILNASKDGFYPVGTADLVKNENIKIVAYPNPVNDKMSIDLAVKKDLHNASYIITDIFGKTISKKSMGNIVKGYEHTYKVDVSTLTTGTYMLSVTSDEGAYTSKFIKK